MLPPDLPVPLALLIVSCCVTVIVALRYLITSGLFALVTARVRPGLYAGRSEQIGREVRWSLLSAVIYGSPAGIVLWGWQHLGWARITADWASVPWWYHPMSVLIYLAVQDTAFYWSHRWMHQPKWFRLAHAVHHQSRPPTAWTAMSFHPIEAMTGAIVVPVLVFFVPIHIAMLGLVLSAATLMGVTNHMGWEMFPRWLVHSPLGEWLITASHHERHHEEYKCNYGLYFRVWDRLCGTDKGLSQRIVAEAGHGAQVLVS
jgi:sterol desaturase/sphingolipid hydroxylase (fatty acid hydroxylase superfamily)